VNDGLVTLAWLVRGRAHLNELLRHAIANGFMRFDFAVGDELYKRDWCDIELNLYDHLAAATARGAIAMALVGACRRAKRMIKQSPTRWPAFSRARALAAVLGRR
jgi:CelD/BcsL family acetyltransferase involved in cellulose biosynthesis